MVAKRPTKPKPYRTFYGDTIKSIYKLFVKPAINILAPLDDESSLSEGVKRFFNADTRSVYFVRVTAEFTMPGKEWLDGHPNVLGYSNASRRVKRGAGLVLRMDELEPNKIELETDTHIYVLDKEMWSRIEEKVEIVG